MNVWVTRDEPGDGPLSTALRAVGLTVVYEPVLERRVVDEGTGAIGRLGPDDWLVLTSVFAVENVPPEIARIPRVAVVSEASRRAAREKGFRVELVSPRGDGASLFEELRRRVERGKVCYPRSSRAKLPESWPGVDLLCPVLYETRSRDFDRSVLDRVDVVAVASPSAVDTIFSAFSEGATPAVTTSGFHPSHVRFASIGPTTSAALRRHGVDPWLESPQPSFESLARAIATSI